MSKIELLAPAGNFECLMAAVQSGADAVYLSGKAFGARSFADNFDHTELENAVDYCHIRGVHVYVTVNTLVLDSEMNSLCEYLIFLNNIGVDGIIVQDMGIVETAQRLVPQLPIHSSTQMTAYSSEGVNNLQRLGIKRVVLARELSLDEIKEISKATTAELEVFGHGALCMCYSGQCLMSSVIGGRSGNRGKCAQPCRMEYQVNNKNKKAFYMSLKDLCSLEYIDKFQEIGISSLKIEGRMKGAAYVAAVVGVYRKYIDNPHKIEKADIELLDAIFNRGGLTDGYLADSIGPNMFAFDKPDNPYLKGNDKLVNELKNCIKAENRKLKLCCSVTIKKGQFPEILVYNQRYKVGYTGEDKVKDAKNAPLTEEMVKGRINKTGGTPFEFEEIVLDMDEGVFLTSGELNNLRRNALERFEEGYKALFKRNATIDKDYEIPGCTNFGNGEFVCEITDFNQYETLKAYPYKYFYIPLHIALKHKDELSDNKEKIVIVPPAIVKEAQREKIHNEIECLLKYGYHGVVAGNIAMVERFKEFKVFGGFRLNIFNSKALYHYSRYGFAGAELSPELNLAQIKGITKSMPVQVMAYGRLPLMVTENCVIKNGDKCGNCENGFVVDRIGMKFPVIKDGDSCRSVILNCKKTFAGYDMEKLTRCGIGLFRLYFTDESPEECRRVTESFFGDVKYRPEDFTGGHFSKGVL